MLFRTSVRYGCAPADWSNFSLALLKLLWNFYSPFKLRTRLRAKTLIFVRLVLLFSLIDVLANSTQWRRRTACNWRARIEKRQVTCSSSAWHCAGKQDIYVHRYVTSESVKQYVYSSSSEGWESWTRTWGTTKVEWKTFHRHGIISCCLTDSLMMP